MKLSSIATINSGIYSNTISNGDVFYIQARDFDENREIASNLSPVLSFTENIEKHFLNKGDILIVAKGATFLSAVYDGSYSPAVASTVFLVICINDKKRIYPQFVSWYLNQNSTQNYLLSLSRGTSIPSINKKMLMEINIPVPTIDKQKLTIELIQLQKKEKFIKRRIDELKEVKLNTIITTALNN
jgi:restriction endonuclease S subunit